MPTERRTMPRLSYLVAAACPAVGLASVVAGHVSYGVALLLAALVALGIALDDWLEELLG